MSPEPPPLDVVLLVGAVKMTISVMGAHKTKIEPANRFIIAIVSLTIGDNVERMGERSEAGAHIWMEAG